MMIMGHEMKVDGWIGKKKIKKKGRKYGVTA